MNPIIKITLTASQLSAVNTIWQLIPQTDIGTHETRVLVSISNHLAEKFMKKQMTLQFSGKTKTTISLEYYKAYFLEIIIWTVVENMPAINTNYQQQQLINLAGDLNQKMT